MNKMEIFYLLIPCVAVYTQSRPLQFVILIALILKYIVSLISRLLGALYCIKYKWIVNVWKSNVKRIYLIHHWIDSEISYLYCVGWKIEFLRSKSVLTWLHIVVLSLIGLLVFTSLLGDACAEIKLPSLWLHTERSVFLCLPDSSPKLLQILL